MESAFSPNGIFWSLQGEGHLRGQQMVFVRLAGCSVGCPQCDTNYKVVRKVSSESIVDEADQLTSHRLREKWVWITGGEPYDRDLHDLIQSFRSRGYSIAAATSGVHRAVEPVDWLSVSPHHYTIVQRFGQEIKLCEGLNGLDPNRWVAENPDDSIDFLLRYVQPLSDENHQEDKDSLVRCMAFLARNPNWSLSRQDHHVWELP